MLLIGSLHDPHLNGVLDLFSRSLAAGGRPRLCIGAWSHLDWHGGIDRLQLAFFRHHLATAPAGPDGEPPNPPPDQADPPLDWVAPEAEAGAPLLLQCPRSGDWHGAASGDPQAESAWRLASDGLAAIRSDEGRLLPWLPDEPPPPASGGLTLVHDPWRPVPARGGHLGPSPGLVERTDLDRRADVACFQTEPLPAPLRLFGRPRLRIKAGADQPGFDLWAALSLVQADRRVLQLSTGVCRVLGERALQHQQQELAMQPLAVQLAAGERLRLSLAGAAWPAIAVNPGDGTLPRGGSGPGHRIISIELSLEEALLWLDPLLLPQLGAN